MTTFIARHGDRSAHSSAALRAGTQRFAHAFVSLGVILRDAVQATRALNDAHTVADRRAVAAGFAGTSTQHTVHPAA